MVRSQERILIIGGSHGISFDLVRRLHAKQTNVTCVSRTPGSLAEHNLLGDTVQHIEFDVVNSDLSRVELPNLLTGFAYFPGSINLGPVKALKPELLRKDFELNVVAAVKCLQAALSALKAAENASAVFFSTVAVARGIAMHSSIAAAKGALQALAKTWAAELAPHIRVNCVAPALTDTPLSQALLSSDVKRKAMSEKYPLGRVGKPADIAAAAEFLLSDQSSWVTGQTFGIDGGMSQIVPL